MKQATDLPRFMVPTMQEFRRRRLAQLKRCPVCRGEAQSECCAVANNIITTTGINRKQRSAAAKAARALMPKLSIIELYFGVKK
jgi:hypothetical protein